VIETAIFYVCALLALGGAAGTVLSLRNTVASALSLLVSMIALAVLFVQLQAQFIGVLQIMVYAGAIIVLFVFVIMLLNLRGRSLGAENQPIVKLIGVALIGLAALQMGVIAGGGRQIFGAVPEGFGGVRSIALLLYTDYLLVVEVSGVLLLSGIVAAVVLAKKELD
jgi:NADH-quinone oxidoreductase subunit J